MAITAFLFHSPWLLNRRPGNPAPLGHGPHSSIFSPTDLNSNCSLGSPEGPLCWVLVLSSASYLQLTRISCRRGYIIVLRPLNSTSRQSRLSPCYLRPDAPVIYTGAFPILTAQLGSIGSRMIDKSKCIIRFKFTSQLVNKRNEPIFKCRKRKRFQLIWKSWITEKLIEIIIVG